MKKILLPAIAALGLAFAAPAFADDTIFNSWSPSDSYPDGNSYVSNKNDVGQSWAVQFNSGADTTLTEVNAYVTPDPANESVTPFVSLSIYSDASGVPGSAMWTSSSIATSYSGVDVGSIALGLLADTNYWLVVLPNDTYDSHWQSGDAAASGPLFEGDGLGAAWVSGSNYLPAAIIYGTAPVTDTGAPEPASLALLGMGLLGTALARRRRG